MSETQAAVQARLIGTIFLERGLVNEAELEAALEKQKSTGERLGEILVNDYGVSRLELAGVLAEQWASLENGPGREWRAAPHPAESTPSQPPAADDGQPGDGPRRPIGEIFVERGIVTEGQLARALEAQRATGKRLGEVLVEQGSLSRLDLAGALAEQWAGFQKLRPPTPKQLKPWQQQEAPPEQPPPGADELAELRASLAALDARLAATEQAGGSTAWREEIAAAAEALASRIDGVEARLAAASSSDEAFADLRAWVATLDARPQLPLERIEGLEGRVEEIGGAVAGRSALETLRGRLDELGGRLEALQATAGLADRVAAVEDRADAARDGIAELSARLDDVAAHAADAASGAVLREADRLDARVDGLAGRLEDIDETVRARESQVDLTAVTRSLADLERKLSENEAAIAGVDARVEPLDDLRSRVRVLEEAPSPVVELAGRVEVLAARLEGLAEADGDALADLRSSVEELVGRPAEVSAEQVAAIALRVEQAERELGLRLEREGATRVELSERLDETARRLESLAGLAGDVDALRAETGRINAVRAEVARLAATHEGLTVRIREVVRSGDIDELRRSHEELADRVGAGASRAELANAVASLQAELGAVCARVGDAVTETRALAAALDACLEDVVARPELAGLAGDLRARLSEIEERLGSVPHQAALDELARQLEGVRTELAATGEGWAAALDARLESVVSRPELDELRRSLETRVESVSPKKLEALAHRVASLSDLVGATGGRAAALESQLDDLRRDALARASSQETLATETAALRGAVDEIVGRLEAEHGERDLLADELLGRIESSEARLAARLAAAEEADARVGERIVSALAELTAGLDDARAESASIRDLVGQTEETLRARVGDIAVRLAADAAERADALGAEVVARAEGQARDAHAAVAAVGEELRNRLERAAAVASRRLARLEESAASAADRESVETRLRQVEEALAEQRQAADGHAKAVERTVSKGLERLGREVAGAGGAYLSAAESLQQTLASLAAATAGEGPGLQTCEAAAAAKADPAKQAALEETPSRSEPADDFGGTFVAFVPTTDGYRLVELAGAAPAAGGEVETGEWGTLAVTRVSRSPLPFDERACVYLERASR